MGGVDTAETLYLKDASTVTQECERTVADGIRILAPGCTVAPETPLENLLAMVKVAKKH
jgi:[methyl-Co(III) methanol-specific corrinoid protein]:coenzyme M methyltransferase